MQEMEPIVFKLYSQANDILLPPEECKDFDQACQNIFAIIYSMFSLYSKRNVEKRDQLSRVKEMKKTIERYYKELKIIDFERKKIN